jgi:hypothetical protein
MLLWIDTKNWLLGRDFFPKALPAYVFNSKPSMRLELMTSSLPMKQQYGMKTIYNKTYSVFISHLVGEIVGSMIYPLYSSDLLR